MPPRCVCCHKLVEEDFSLCSSCFSDVEFIEKPFCKTCGNPFELEVEEESDCLGCIKHKRPFNLSRSIFKYKASARNIIHKLKYNDSNDVSKYLSKIIGSKYTDIIKDADIICCVPMHKFKRIFRMYNHAQLLAKDVADQFGKEFIPNLLLKTRNTKSQTFLSKLQRKTNLKGSISFNDKFCIKNKKVLLIDDVITTSETNNECCKRLKE